LDLGHLGQTFGEKYGEKMRKTWSQICQTRLRFAVSMAMWRFQCRHFINALLSTVRLGSRGILVFLGGIFSGSAAELFEQNWLVSTVMSVFKSGPCLQSLVICKVEIERLIGTGLFAVSFSSLVFAGFILCRYHDRIEIS